MDNIDFMVDPKIHGTIRGDMKFQIIDMAFNIKAARYDRRVVNEILYYREILFFEYKWSRYYYFREERWLPYIRKDRKEINQRILDIATKRKDWDMLKLLNSLDPSYFYR
jgi:hypothetical protein